MPLHLHNLGIGQAYILIQLFACNSCQIYIIGTHISGIVSTKGSCPESQELPAVPAIPVTPLEMENEACAVDPVSEPRAFVGARLEPPASMDFPRHI